MLLPSSVVYHLALRRIVPCRLVNPHARFFFLVGKRRRFLFLFFLNEEEFVVTAATAAGAATFHCPLSL